MGGTIRPDMGFPDRSDDAAPDPFLDQAVTLKSHPLVAHLGGDLGVSRRLAKRPGFVDGASQRLFTIDVLAGFDGRHGRDGVNMIGSRHDDGVNIALLFQHDAKVLMEPGFWKIALRAGRARLINVAKGNDVLALNALNVFGAASAGADDSDVKLFTRRDLPRAAQDVPWRDDERSRTHCRGLKESAAIELISDFRFRICDWVHFGISDLRLSGPSPSVPLAIGWGEGVHNSFRGPENSPGTARTALEDAVHPVELRVRYEKALRIKRRSTG